jgi:ribonuclease HI
VVTDAEGKLVGEAFRFLGHATNNVAEYSALILGLERAAEIGGGMLEVRADSELLVRQMRGEYRIKNEALRKLASKARVLARAFERVDYVHVRRELNRDADRLANRAIDESESS